MDNIGLRLWQRSRLNATTYLGVAMIALIWVGLLWNQHTGRRNFVEAARENGSNLARAYEESVICSVGEIDKTLLLLRARYLANPKQFNIRDVRADPLLSSDLVRNAALIDANGIMTVSDSATKDQRFDLSDREHFRAFLADPSDRLYIGKPVIGRAANTWATFSPGRS